MSKEAALRAYRDSVYDAAELNANYRVRSRSMPIVGGLLTAFQQLGNELWRPFKVTGALVAGYKDAERKFPAMPEVPEAFKGTELEKSFVESWKYKEQEANARIRSVAKLLNFDVSGWWQEASVAAHVQAKDMSVAFPEEAMARAQGGGGVIGAFTGALAASRGVGDSGRSQ